MQGVVFTASLLYYANFWEDPKLVEDRFGAILTVLMLMLLASPLLSLVLKTFWTPNYIEQTFLIILLAVFFNLSRFCIVRKYINLYSTFNLCLIINHFFQGEIIRTKSTATLPFPIILSGFIVTFEWLLYGIIINNIFIQVIYACLLYKNCK